MLPRGDVAITMPEGTTAEERELIERTFAENHHLRSSDVATLARWARLTALWGETSAVRAQAKPGSAASSRALRTMLAVSSALSAIERELGLSSMSRRRILSVMAAETRAPSPPPVVADAEPDEQPLPPNPIGWGVRH